MQPAWSKSHRDNKFGPLTRACRKESVSFSIRRALCHWFQSLGTAISTRLRGTGSESTWRTRTEHSISTFLPPRRQRGTATERQLPGAEEPAAACGGGGPGSSRVPCCGEAGRSQGTTLRGAHGGPPQLCHLRALPTRAGCGRGCRGPALWELSAEVPWSQATALPLSVPVCLVQAMAGGLGKGGLPQMLRSLCCSLDSTICTARLSPRCHS